MIRERRRAGRESKSLMARRDVAPQHRRRGGRGVAPGDKSGPRHPRLHLSPAARTGAGGVADTTRETRERREREEAGRGGAREQSSRRARAPAPAPRRAHHAGATRHDSNPALSSSRLRFLPMKMSRFTLGLSPHGSSTWVGGNSERATHEARVCRRHGHGWPEERHHTWRAGRRVRPCCEHLAGEEHVHALVDVLVVAPLHREHALHAVDVGA